MKSKLTKLLLFMLIFSSKVGLTAEEDINKKTTNNSTKEELVNKTELFLEAVKTANLSKEQLRILFEAAVTTGNQYLPTNKPKKQ